MLPNMVRSQSELLIFNAQTGAVTGEIPDLGAYVRLLGYAADGKSLWTGSFTSEPAMIGEDTPDGTLRVQQWAVPTFWPPAWLLAVTCLALLIAVADYRHSYCRLRKKCVSAASN